VREFLTGKSLFEDGGELAVLLREERQIALRAAYVSSKDHLSPFVLIAVLRGAMDA
jgi:hypothetical protein